MIQSNYEVEILVNGHPTKEYFRIENGKTYIEGKIGSAYRIKIKNNGYRKILAVPTVDGLSVIDGKVADYNSPGYVVEGYSSTIIDGWRKSNLEVAEFYFSDVKNSYANRTGHPLDVGIIGVAIFREKEIIQNIFIGQGEISKPIEPYKPYWPDSGIYLCSNMCSMVSDKNENNNQKIGTGWGQNKRSEAVDVLFDKEFNPETVFEIYYNNKKQLERIGIDMQKRPMCISPRAFPNRFCEPPK